MTPKLALVAATLVLLPLAAGAQSYRCVGKDGKKYYGSVVPEQCLGMPVEQLNKQGMVTRRFDAQASAAERAKKEAEKEEIKKREAISREEGRRNRALLATYTSEKDIESARSRALQDNQVAVKDIERRIAALHQQKAELSKELDSFKGDNKPPATLRNRLRNLDIDLKAQDGLLAAKQKEVATINAKYDSDKKRYLELTRGATK